MYPILYEANETLFQSNGIAVLVDAYRCDVTEQRNGIYELEMDYPISGKHYNDIIEGRIIGAIHDDRRDVQPFVIYSRSADIGGKVTFYAHHISYKLGLIVAKPFSAGSAALAMSSIVSNTVNYCPFTFYTDKMTQADFSMVVPKSVKDLLGGTEGSILDVFGGGEYEWDKFQVKLYQNRGINTDVKILYGKNLMTLKQSLDTSGCYTAAVPYWYSEDAEGGSTLVTVSGYVVTPTGMTDTTKTAMMDLSGEFETQPTATQLRDKAVQILDKQKPWVPPENISISFAALWQTEDYKLVAPLERVSLCDTVIVSYPELGIDNVRSKVVKVVYNTLLERYNSMELGELRTSFSESVRAQVNNDIKKAVSANQSFMANAIAEATAMITGGLGGYLVIGTDADGHPNELLIMDRPTKEAAVNVWRFNSGGLGHSHSGYNGPFSDVALTMDGKINANMITTGAINANLITTGSINANLITTGTLSANLITTGTLSANRVRAGTISDETNKNSWNLTTGYFSTKNGSIGGFTIDSSGLNATVSGQTVVIDTQKIKLNSYDSNTNERMIQVTSTGIDLLVEGNDRNMRSYLKGDRIYTDDFGLYCNNSGARGLYDFAARKWVLRCTDADDVGDEGADAIATFTMPMYSLGWDGNTTRRPVQSDQSSNSYWRVGYMSAVADCLRVRGQWGSYWASDTSYIQGHDDGAFRTHSFSWSGSDIRIKTEIAESKVDALALLRKIRIMEFKKDGNYQPIGMIADWVEELDPRLAIGGGYDEDGNMNIKGVDTFYLQGYEVKAIQELSDKVDKLEAKIERLEAIIDCMGGEQ